MNTLATLIVTFNSRESIESCLASLIANLPGPDENPIVVIDNASEDGTADFVAANFPRVHLFRNRRNIGFGAALNRAMSNVSSQYWYFHNPDAYLEGDIITPALAAMGDDPKLGILGFRLRYPDGRPQTSAYAFTSPLKWFLQDIGAAWVARTMAGSSLGRLLLHPFRQSKMSNLFVETHSALARTDGSIVTADWVTGAAMLMRREVFLETGGFDERIFLYGEDEDLCIRAAGAGWKIGQLSTQPVVHNLGWEKRGKRSGPVARLRYDSQSYFIDKHFRDRPLSRFAMKFLLRLRCARW